MPLNEPPREKVIQLVIRTGTSEFRRVSVDTRPSEWSLVRFTPKKAGEPVVAEQKGDDFFFVGADDTQFKWMGELKAEFAQRIVHRFTFGLSRVAIDNSEWLRRQENLAD